MRALVRGSAVRHRSRWAGRGRQRAVGRGPGHFLIAPARAVLDGVLDALLPQTCAACDAWIGAGDAPLCPSCRAELEETGALPRCPRCGRTMLRLSIHERHCARCRTERFWNAAGIAVVGEYQVEPLRRLLVGLKFAGSERQADCLGALLADALRKQAWLSEIEALVPVPMHRLRRAQRPCEHARALAEAVSRRLRIPVRRGAVRRIRYSISQTRTPSRAERFKNVKGCFGPSRRPRIAGKTVCIVDNLLVSGATIHEVSKVLRAAGAKRIYAAVVAHATLPGDPERAAAALTAPPDQPD